MEHFSKIKTVHPSPDVLEIVCSYGVVDKRGARHTSFWFMLLLHVVTFDANSYVIKIIHLVWIIPKLKARSEILAGMISSFEIFRLSAPKRLLFDFQNKGAHVDMFTV